MVVALGPGKFYGSSLPRPWFYTDVKYNDERVDPPAPVTDPFMSWAKEAHWSMGGLSFDRHRLQGRIEGNVKKLRKQQEKASKKSERQQNSPSKFSNSEKASNLRRLGDSPSPPPAPVAIKRRRIVSLVDEEEVEDAEPRIKKVVRKLGKEFERVAAESGMTRGKGGSAPESANEKEITVSKRRKKLVKGGRTVGAAVVGAAVRIRSSPRLARSSFSGLC